VSCVKAGLYDVASTMLQSLFAGAVLKAAEKASELGRHQRIVLTRWSCLVMEQLDPVEHAGAFTKIAAAQGTLLAAAALAQCVAAPVPCG